MTIFKAKSAKTYLNIIALLATVIALSLYSLAVTSYLGSVDSRIIAFFIISILLEIAVILLHSEWVRATEIIIAFLCTAISMMIVTHNDVVMSFVDLVNNIDYFGNAAMIPSVITTILFSFLSALLCAISAFHGQKAN